MINRWFISYKYIDKDFMDQTITEEGLGACITDVSPARWVLHARLKTSKDHYILYAEEISSALAVELVHGGAGIPAMFFKEVESNEVADI